jgi:hypothetical protein
MRMAAVLLALLFEPVFWVSGAEAQPRAQGSAEATPTIGNDAVKERPPIVTLLTPGKRPHQLLRMRFEVGARRTLTMTIDSKAQLAVAGGAGLASQSPPLITTMEIQVDEVTPEGDALIRFRLTHAAVADTSALDPDAAASIGRALDSIVGLQGSYRCTVRGLVSDVWIGIPRDSSPMLRQLLEDVRQSLQQIAAPLPERRVGRGAKWRVETGLQLVRVRAVQCSTFRVTSMRRPIVNVDLAVEQSADPQTMAAPGIPENEWAELRSLRSIGGGKARWNLEQLGAVRAQMSSKLVMEIGVRDRAAREHAMTMTMSTDVTMLNEPSAARASVDPFDAQAVQTKIKTRLWQVRECYERELPIDPGLAGKVVMEFQIEESGRVSRAEAIENTTGSESIAACIGGELLLLRFDPGPEGGSVVFKYPFVFKPAQD